MCWVLHRIVGDLREYDFDILRLKQYHMGRTADPVEIRARDTAEEVVQMILEHDAHASKILVAVPGQMG